MKKPYSTNSNKSLNTKKKSPGKHRVAKSIANKLAGFKRNSGNYVGYKPTKER